MLSDSGLALLFPVLLLLVAVYRFVVHPAWLSPLAQIPHAHWSCPYSRLWALRIRFGRAENATLLALHRRLGPVVRVAPDELSIDGVDGVRLVYQGGFDKPTWYSVFDNYGVPCMFSMRGSREHSRRKRMLSRVYAKSYLHASPAAAEQSRILLFDRLLPLLQQPSSSAGLDVHPLFLAAAMDFVSAYVFGIGSGTDFLGDEAYRDEWLALYQSRSDYGLFDQELPALTSACRALGIPLCPRRVDRANRELGAWCRRLCSAAAAASSSSSLPPSSSRSGDPVVFRALLAGLSRQDGAGAAKGGGDEELTVASELFDHVLAGHETAGVTLTYLAWRLSQRPSLQRALRRELLSLQPDLVLPHHDDHDDHDRSSRAAARPLPDPKQLDRLPLLHAVITETLRLHAPIPGPQPRETPPSGSQIGPYAVPGGVRVAALAYTLHRNERVFPEPEKWDHTRWLASAEATDDERKERNRYFWAFGSGGRMCIGSNFAMHEMKLVAAAIYSNFTSRIVDDDGLAAQTDGYTSRPAKERLVLSFRRVGGAATS